MEKKTELSLSIEIEVSSELPHVIFFGKARWENHGIGAYECHGYKGYDSHWCWTVEEFMWDSDQYTEEENEIIKAYSEEHADDICTKLEEKAYE